jgi:hypothetical protein
MHIKCMLVIYYRFRKKFFIWKKPVEFSVTTREGHLSNIARVSHLTCVWGSDDRCVTAVCVCLVRYIFHTCLSFRLWACPKSASLPCCWRGSFVWCLSRCLLACLFLSRLHISDCCLHISDLAVCVYVNVCVSRLHVVQTGSGAHPTSCVMGTAVSFPGGEADCSPPTIAEVKKMWIYASTPPYAFMV